VEPRRRRAVSKPDHSGGPCTHPVSLASDGLEAEGDARRARLIACQRGAGNTRILKLRVALRLGVPLSLTRTVAGLVLGAGTVKGVQLKRPVAD